jgi:Raf kinase inhibitor-like YbhB/YbcL family protein
LTLQQGHFDGICAALRFPLIPFGIEPQPQTSAPRPVTLAFRGHVSRRRVRGPAGYPQRHKVTAVWAGGVTRRTVFIVICAMWCSLTAGCGLVGGTNTGSFDVPQVITVTSLAFRDQGVIPRRYTCFGKGLSPPLHWSGVPTGTKALALVVDDSGAPVKPYIYWLVFDISPQTAELQEASLPPNARQAQGSNKLARYNPPCPRTANHSYRFTVYAMDSSVSLPNGAGEKATWTAIAQRAIARGRLTGIAQNPHR